MSSTVHATHICRSVGVEPVLVLIATTMALVGCGTRNSVDKVCESACSPFIAELAPGQSRQDLERAAEEILRGDTAVEALFPTTGAGDDPFGLSRIYRVVTSTAVASDQESWNLAYQLKRRGNFVRAEPDLDRTLRESADRAAVGACFGNDGVPEPIDPSWSLRDPHMDVLKARTLVPPPGGKALGEGIRICHPDSGWTSHVDLDEAQIDRASGLNLIEGGNDARDPLGYSGNPGHGTATGSVIISSGDFADPDGTTPPGTVVGLAPKATLVPIRALKSVVQVFDSDIARAVRHAVDARCDVISMSLGGRAFFGLERAIKDAVRRDVIVVTAAGNCVGFIVAPAVYDESIAVAATNFERKPWIGSSHGRGIEISAPGEDVHVARAEAGSGSHEKTGPGNGTSFAAAAVAGAAALWIAHNGSRAIDATKGPQTRRDLFVAALTGSAKAPSPWDPTQYGPGIINVHQLLLQDLGSLRASAASRESNDTVSLLARMFDRDIVEVRGGLSRLLGQPTNLDERLNEVGPELIDLASRDPDLFRRALEPRVAGDSAAAAAHDASVATLERRASNVLAGMIPSSQ